MGNAPLPSSPPPTPHCFILRVTTKGRVFGRKLCILPSNEDGAEEESALPPPLQGGHISELEFQDKRRQLEQRLAAWKGGWAAIIVMCWSIVILLAFFYAFFTPHLWKSGFMDHPGWIMLIACVQIVVFALLLGFTRRESTRLLEDVEDLYRSWRARGVHVSMKQVASFGDHYSGGERHRARRDVTAGKQCFCVIMNVAHEGGDDEDMSVATMRTVDSLNSDYYEKNDDCDETDGLDGDSSDAVEKAEDVL